MRGVLTRRAIARVKGVRRARLEIVRREVATYASSLSAHGSSAVVAALDAALDRRNSQPSPRRTRRLASSPRRSRPVEARAAARTTRQHDPRDKARSMAQGARLAAREAVQAAGEDAALADEAEGIGAGLACATKATERPQLAAPRPTAHFVATRLRSVATQTDDGAPPQGEEGAAVQAAMACADAGDGSASSVVRSHSVVRMDGDDLLLTADEDEEDGEAEDTPSGGGGLDALTWAEEVAAAQEGHGWVQRVLLHMQRSAASIAGTGEAEDDDDDDGEDTESEDEEEDDPLKVGRRSVTNLDTGVTRTFTEQEAPTHRARERFHLFRDWGAEASRAAANDATPAVRRLRQHAVELEVDAAGRGVEVQQLRAEMARLKLQLRQATDREHRRASPPSPLRDDLGELLAQKIALQAENAALHALLRRASIW